MDIANHLSDDAILAELGQRIAQRRIRQQFTQAELAQQAGVAKRTVERIEAGASAQLSNLVRIFRVLDLLQSLDGLIPEVEPSPIDLLKHKGKLRQRASKSRRQDQTDEPWAWDDDT